MAIRYIDRFPSVRNGAQGLPTAAPIYVDSDDNILKMIPAGSGTTQVQIVDASSTQTLTNKTLTAPVLTAPVISGAGSIAAGSTLAQGVINADHIVQAASQTVDNSSVLAALSTPAIWTVVAGATYVFDLNFNTTCTTNGGIAVGFTLATATLTSIRYNYELHSAVDKTDAIGGTGTTTTSGTKMVADKSVAWTRVRVFGSFVVNAGGTFSFTVSQETAATGGDVSLFLIGSQSRVTRVL